MRVCSFPPNARSPARVHDSAAGIAARPELLLVSLPCVQQIDDGVPAVLLLPYGHPAFPPAFQSEPGLPLPVELAAAIAGIALVVGCSGWSGCGGRAGSADAGSITRTGASRSEVEPALQVVSCSVEEAIIRPGSGR